MQSVMKALDAPYCHKCGAQHPPGDPCDVVARMEQLRQRMTRGKTSARRPVVIGENQLPASDRRE